MAEITRDSQFSYFSITNGHALIKGEEKSKKLGCTGELEVESETKTITKKCEGVDKESRSIVVGQTIKFVGHIERDVLNEAFGIDTKGLKEGVYSYGKNSLGKQMCLTWTAKDLMETDEEYLAFPNCTANTGFALSIKNGEEEVAEIEMEFKVSMDDFENFMYKGFKSELGELAKTWHTKFDPALAQAEAIPKV